MQKHQTAKKIGLGFLLVALVFTMAPNLSQAQAGEEQSETSRVILEPGDVFKGNNDPNVFYLGNDNKRYVFPTPAVYFSWYRSQGNIITVPQEVVGEYALGGNVTMRPGTCLVKFTGIPEIYAVEPRGVLREVPDRQTFNVLGYNTEMIAVIPVMFMTNYTVGQNLSMTHPDGTLVKHPDFRQVYYMEDGKMRYISPEAFRANNFRSTNIMETRLVAIYPIGLPIEGEEVEITTVAGPLPNQELPDLSVENIEVVYATNDTREFSVVIKNNSAVVLNQNFNIVGSNCPDNPFALCEALEIWAMESYQPFEFKTYIFGPYSVSTGHYDFEVVVDPNNSVLETNEDNNSMDYAYEVSGEIGELAVSIHPDTPDADVVVSGTDDVEFTKVRFVAEGEDMVVTALALVNDYAAVPGDYDDNIDLVELTYMNSEGEEDSVSVSFVGGQVIFSIGQLDIYCPEGGAGILTVTANLRTIAEGAVSGDTPKVSLRKTSDQFGPSAALTDEFIAYGHSSGYAFHGQTDGITLNDSVVNAMTVRKTKVTAEDNSSSLPTYRSPSSVDNIGIFKFHNVSQPGIYPSSIVNDLTINLEGTLLSSSPMVNDFSVKVYKSSTFNSANLVCQADGADGEVTFIGSTMTATCSSEDFVAGNNEFDSERNFYVVVDTTDYDVFDHPSSTASSLMTTLTAYQWHDGEALAVPVTGLPVIGKTLLYQ